MSGSNVDTRTDVYSLGVLLYQLLVGVLPFDPVKLRERGHSEMLRIIRETEPPRPSTRFRSRDEGSKAWAEALRREVYDRRLDALGPDHRDTLRAAAALGAVLIAQDRLNEAEPLIEEGRATERDAAHERAAELYRDASERSSRVRGEDHRSTLSSRYMLAITYMNLHREEEAERLLEEVTETRLRTLGPDHLETLGGMGQLARLYITQGRWREAEAMAGEATERAIRTVGPDHTATAVYRYRLGIARLELGRPRSAEEELLAAYRAVENRHGPQHVWAQRIATVLADVCEATGRPEAAARWRATLSPEWVEFVEASRREGRKYD